MDDRSAAVPEAHDGRPRPRELEESLETARAHLAACERQRDGVARERDDRWQKIADARNLLQDLEKQQTVTETTLRWKLKDVVQAEISLAQVERDIRHALVPF